MPYNQSKWLAKILINQRQNNCLQTPQHLRAQLTLPVRIMTQNILQFLYGLWWTVLQRRPLNFHKLRSVLPCVLGCICSFKGDKVTSNVPSQHWLQPCSCWRQTRNLPYAKGLLSWHGEAQGESGRVGQRLSQPKRCAERGYQLAPLLRASPALPPPLPDKAARCLPCCAGD